MLVKRKYNPGKDKALWYFHACFEPLLKFLTCLTSYRFMQAAFSL